MDSGALAPAVGRGLQAEVGAAGRPRTSHQHMQLWGGCGGLHPVTHNISKVLSVHPTLDTSLSSGPRSPVAPVVGGGRCSLGPLLRQLWNQALVLSKPHT